MSQTIIEYKKIGRPEQDLYIVLLNGSEIGTPVTKADAEAIVLWFPTAEPDLRKRL